MMLQFNGVKKMYRVTKPFGKKSTAICSVFLAGLLMSGCASYQRDHVTVGSVPSDYRTKHPIMVSQDEVKADIVVGSSMKGMSFRQENVVNDFVRRFRQSGARNIRLILPSGSANEASARRVSKGIVHQMKKHGVQKDQIKVLSYHASGHGDAATIRMSYDHVAASVSSKCGEWDDDLNNTVENRNYSNFGCATQNNLAEMVANPEDLVNPRGSSEIDATRRNTIINDWRENGSDALPSLL